MFCTLFSFAFSAAACGVLCLPLVELELNSCFWCVAAAGLLPSLWDSGVFYGTEWYPPQVSYRVLEACLFLEVWGCVLCLIESPGSPLLAGRQSSEYLIKPHGRLSTFPELYRKLVPILFRSSLFRLCGFCLDWVIVCDFVF